MPTWQTISWPTLLIGLIMLAYWLRVMWMVHTTPRAAGHHANLIPEERLGRRLRIVWTPVIILWIVLPIADGLGVLGRNVLVRPVYRHDLVQWIALSIVAIAFALTWVCWIRMGKSWRMGIDPQEKTELVFTGPFAYVRHPIYGLSSLMMLMTVVALPTPPMIAAGMLHLFLMQWEVRREDVYLSTVHGEPYVLYRQHVGRFLPKSLQPYRPMGRA